MQAVAGNPSVRVTRQDVADGLKAAGVVPGDVAMFHSSLSSMGHVEGGADAVIGGFLDAVGPEGTVAVPALCVYSPEEKPAAIARWSPRTTPCFTGRIPETFRQRPDALRSDHFTHSVAAIGARAAELTSGHGAGGLRPGPWGPKTFAAESPWERFRRWNAAYCFLGVTFRVNTMVHYVEHVVAEKSLAKACPDTRSQLASELADWQRPGVWPRISIESRESLQETLLHEGVVRRASVGCATLLVARAKPMIARWLELAESAPEQWYSPEFVEWRRKCLAE